MDKMEKIRKMQCLREGCKFARENRCRIYWGQKCNRLGGRKIPRIISRYEFIDISD
jgi:hypothetical protein